MASFGELSTISHIRPQLTLGGGCSSCCTDFDRPSHAQQQPLMGWNYLFWRGRVTKRWKEVLQPLPTTSNFPLLFPESASANRRPDPWKFPSEQSYNLESFGVTWSGFGVTWSGSHRLVHFGEGGMIEKLRPEMVN